MENQKPNEIVQINADKISAITQYTPAEVAIVKANVAKGTNDMELAYFMSICRQTGLNPFTKEIWCYKDNKNNLIVFTGRDGFLRKAQDSPRWNGMASAAVYENDFFEIDTATCQFSHKPDFKNRGEIIGAYAIVKPKDCELPTFEWADFKVYNKALNGGKNGYSKNVWDNDPEAMIKKVAESHALKKAFGINGLQSEYDFDVKNNVAIPVQEAKEVSELDELRKKIIDGLDTYQGEDKKDIQDECTRAQEEGKFNVEFAADICGRLGIDLL